jgi:hypothetical protein
VYLEEADVDLAAIWIVVHRVVVSVRRGLRGCKASEGAELLGRLEWRTERYVLACVGWCWLGCCRPTRRFFEVSLERRGLSRLRLKTPCATSAPQIGNVRLRLARWSSHASNAIHDMDRFKDWHEASLQMKCGIVIRALVALPD